MTEIADAIRIDQHALDVEWLRQAELYFEYASLLVDQRLDVDAKKSNIDIVKAESDKDIRNNPGRFGIVKVTEACVGSALNGHPNVIEAVKEHRDAKHDQGMLEAAVAALDHKKRALEKLVDLHHSSYFARPQARSEGSKEEVSEIEKKSARRTRKAPEKKVPEKEPERKKKQEREGTEFTVQNNAGSIVCRTCPKLAEAINYTPTKDDPKDLYIFRHKENGVVAKLFKYNPSQGAWERPSSVEVD